MNIDQQINEAITRLLMLLAERRRPGRQQQVKEQARLLHDLWQQRQEAQS